MITYSCFIPGKPEQQGSARAYTYRRSAERGGGIGARVDSMNKSLKGWRRRAAEALHAARTRRGELPEFAGAVSSRALFIMPRLSSHPKTIKGASVGWPDSYPDLDKLQRALGDALVDALVLKDDGLVCEWIVRKRFALLDEEPGVLVRIELLPDPDAVAPIEELSFDL